MDWERTTGVMMREREWQEGIHCVSAKYHIAVYGPITRWIAPTVASWEDT